MFSIIFKALFCNFEDTSSKYAPVPIIQLYGLKTEIIEAFSTFFLLEGE
jgi:hypothetical protein